MLHLQLQTLRVLYGMQALRPVVALTFKAVCA